VNIHKVAATAEPAQAPTTIAQDTATPCDGVTTKKASVSNMPIFLECGIPKSAKADINKADDWITCSSEVTGDDATCDLPMMTLEAQRSLESYCVLTEGKGGKQLTQPVWRNVSNTVKKQHIPTQADQPQSQPQPPQQQRRGPQEHASEVVRVPSDDAKKKRAQPVQNTEKAYDVDVRDMVEASDKSIRDLGRASKEKPPYMKYSDAEKKTPPPGDKIIEGVDNLRRASQEHGVETVHKARETTREQSQAISHEVSKDADEAEESIIKSSEDLETGVEATHDDAVEGANHAKNRATQVTREAGETLQDVRESGKPPYMKYKLYSEADKKDPVPAAQVVRMLNAVPRPPILTKLA